MRLIEAQVTKFKSVWDSTRIAIEPDVTALVGKNESGKTAVLQALYRLRPLSSGHPKNFDELRDYPRRYRSRDQDTIEDARPVLMKFVLDDDDVGAIEREFGPNVVIDRAFSLSKGYDGDEPAKVQWAEAPKVSATAALRHAVAAAGLDADRYVGESVSDTIAKLRADSDAEAAVALGDSLAERNLITEVWNAIFKRVPYLLYFDEYQTLPGRVSIRRLQTVGEEALEPGEQTALSLLRLARVDTSEFTEAVYEPRKAALEAAANQLTDGRTL